MYGRMREELTRQLGKIREAGLHKEERELVSRQDREIAVEYPHGEASREVLNFCANNYLGLASHPDIVRAAHAGLDAYGFGLSSVRFICGTQEVHKELERQLSDFLGTEDTILYSSCFDANGGLFETLLGPEDAVISDRLNHASLIDGIRLCKARRYVYQHNDMADLETRLQEAADARFRMIVTDGVFSMDGDVAKLAAICDLAEKHDALVMVDDSHATGFWGPTGRGSHEYCGVMGRVDIITTTLGKALGGASGGCTSGRAEIIALLRQRSRPYLFSNSVAPVVAAASLKALELARTAERREKLARNTDWFRKAMTEAGLNIRAGEHPIVPVMLYNAQLAQDIARDLYSEGIYVIGFSFPVVPRGEARIRVQVSAAHEQADLEQCVGAFARVAERYSILGKSAEEIMQQYGT